MRTTTFLRRFLRSNAPRIAALAALVAFGAVASFQAPAGQASTPRTVDIEARDPSGHRITYSFLLTAPSDEAAYDTAVAAVAGLNPAAEIADRSGELSAQHAPWGWAWSDDEIAVPVGYNPTGAVASANEAAVANALATWSNVKGSRFAYRYAGITSAAPGTHAAHFDGANVIGWMALPCGSGCVLGVTSKFDDVREIDIVLNSDPLANAGDGTGGTLDIETIVLHEAGHMAGLEHSCQPFVGPCSDDEGAAIMFFRYRGIHRTLGADDIAGIIASYPAAGGGSQPPAAGVPSEQSTVSVSTQPGWNLSLLPAGSLGAIMQLLPCVNAVYALDAQGNWLTWVRGANPQLNTLDVATVDEAYWLSSSGACSASFTAFQ